MARSMGRIWGYFLARGALASRRQGKTLNGKDQENRQEKTQTHTLCLALSRDSDTHGLVVSPKTQTHTINLQRGKKKDPRPRSGAEGGKRAI